MIPAHPQNNVFVKPDVAHRQRAKERGFAPLFDMLEQNVRYSLTVLQNGVIFYMFPHFYPFALTYTDEHNWQVGGRIDVLRLNGAGLKFTPAELEQDHPWCNRQITLRPGMQLRVATKKHGLLWSARFQP